MKNKKVIAIFISLVVIVGLFIVLININRKDNESKKIETITTSIKNVDFESDDLDDSIPKEYTTINLNEKSGDIKIDTGGVYLLTGNLDGSIIIDVKNDVRLILDNVKIVSQNYSAIYVENANKVIITLKEGTTNYIEDGKSYNNLDENNEPNATIFSHDDLVFNGKGTLEIKSNYEDAIASKDGLKIANGTFNIESVDDGIRGKDYLYILDGTFNIKSSGDGLKSTNQNDSSLGYIKIVNGIFNIDSTNDAINAETNLLIESGEFNITTTSTSTTTSTKGLKANSDIQIDGGTFNIDTKDDAIHCNLNVIINGGTFEINTGDDGIHAFQLLSINNGYINIKDSYEGIEANNISINGGEIYVVSSDDGINAAGGNDSSGFGPRQDNFAGGGNSKLEINDGYIYVNAKGDGVDSNGSISMNGGTLIVDGPTNSGNGALDFDSTFDINGGILIAAGASGMAQTPSNSSGQYVLSINTNQSENTFIHIEDEKGNIIVSYAPSKSYQSFIVSTPDIKQDETYNIYYGGNCDSSNNKLCTSYVKGTLLGSITVSDIISSYGTSSNMGAGMNPGMNGRDPGINKGQEGMMQRR